ncbi:MAG: hypothetical protein Q8O10_02395 [candidate division Zixibacteria bacterium]|nr:hypothetical protein [candidate division Zixibacteria bacterium]
MKSGDYVLRETQISSNFGRLQSAGIECTLRRVDFTPNSKAKRRYQQLQDEKNTSLAKTQANRKNALNSTGPKTLEGKNVVKWNALKHGLLSKEIIIKAGDGKESKAEFKVLLSELREDLQPEGILEEMLVEKIVICYWRLRRALRCEIGEIRRDLDTASFKEIFRRLDQVRFEKQFLGLGDSRHNLEKNSLGLHYLLGVLEDVRKGVEEMGHLSEESMKQLAKNFGGDENGLTHWCFIFSKMATEGPEEAKRDPEHYGDTPAPEKCKEIISRMINDEKKKMEDLKEIIEENENLEMEAKIASLSLPSKEAVDKILRYETTIERQLYRAMSELERLQRQRKGEFLPPPIHVEVSSDK